jgi:hypothetical protein
MAGFVAPGDAASAGGVAEASEEVSDDGAVGSVDIATETSKLAREKREG